jgi:hypothetical protein
VCLNTYGSLDFFYKLVQDSNIPNADAIPATGQQFLWDRELVVDTQVLRTTTLGNIIYATVSGTNGNTLSVTIGTGQPIPPTGGGVPLPPTATNVYQKTSATYYTATTDNESTVTLLGLISKNIIQIERNIQPIIPTTYNWNNTTGVLTLDDALMTGETLYILYTEMIVA